MGCGANIRTNEKISESTKKAEIVRLSGELEENEKLAFDKDIEKEGVLQSNRKGRPIVVQSEKNKKHWIFNVEETVATEGFVIRPWHGVLKVPEYFKPIKYGIDDAVFETSFVYGYECVESRNNLFYVKESGCIVFPAGIFGIVYNIAGNTQKIYKEHNDEIVALCVHKQTNTIATGDKRFLICVWDSEKLVTYCKNKRQVKGTLCLSFCVNSELLAVLGGDFNLIVYKWADFSIIFSVGFKSTVFYMALNPKILLACVVGKKFVGFVSSAGIIENASFGNKGKVCTMVCATWLDSICLTGATNGQIYKWNPPTLECAFQVFELGVTIHALKVNQDKVFCSGADRTLVLLNAEMEFLKKINLPSYAKSMDFFGESVILGLNNGSIVTVDEDVEEVFFGFSEEIVGIVMVSETVMLVAVSSEVRVMDYMKRRVLTRISFKSLFDSFYELEDHVDIVVRAVDFNKILTHVAISVGNGFLAIYKYQHSIRNIKSIKLNELPINVVRYSHNGTYLACGAVGSIILMLTADYSLVQTLNYANKIVSIDWNLEDSRFQTSSHNFDLKFWTVEGEELQELNEKLSSWSSRVGWPLRALNNDYIDFSHLICVQGSNELLYVAAGDDWGVVSVFEILAENGKKLKCQASHVNIVKWSLKDDFVFSGGNRCVVQSKFYNNH